MGFEPGTKLGPYVVEAFIDAGGMGEVYRALDPRLQRRVAIKVLPASLAEQEAFRRRFERETHAISRLNHKNICTVFDTGTYEGRPFTVMELLAGDTLERILEAGSVDIEMVLQIGIDVANGLDAAHGSGIIHRDIKSANIFVTTSGDAKVLDFGIAKMLQSELDTRGSARTRITGDRTPLGTVAYMSPEQARGEQVDARSDLFSLGVVLHEMATGMVPFRGTTTSVLAQLVSPDPIPAPRSIQPGLPIGLERIICRALEKDPRVRYQTAADLLADLRRLRRDLFLSSPALDREVAGAPGGRRSMRRRKLSSALVLAAVTLTTLALLANQFFPFATGRIKSFAVIPCMGPDLTAEAEHTCRTVAYRLIGALSEASSELDVRSLSLVLSHMASQTDVFEIGRQLGVHGIASLKLSEGAEGTMVDVEVSDVRSGNFVYRGTIPLGGAASQGSLMEIASNVADQIHLRLSETEREIWNLERMVLDAEYQWKLRQPASLEKALATYHEAIRRDPDHAKAHAGLAITYILSHYYGTLLPSEAYPRAQEEAERAIELDDTLADAHATLGLVYRDFHHQFSRAETEFTRALQLNGESVSALQWYAEYLAITGQFDTALAYIRQAETLDPLQTAVRSVHGWIYVCAGRPQEGADKLREVLRMQPDDALATWFLGQAQFAQGDFVEAFETLKRAADLSGNQSRVVADYAAARAMAGQRDVAVSFLRSLEAKSDSGANVSPYESAIVHAALGQRDLAFGDLEQALDEGTWQVANMAVDPMLASLRDDARFPVILQRVGLPGVTASDD